jgi:hypothetical protein
MKLSKQQMQTVWSIKNFAAQEGTLLRLEVGPLRHGRTSTNISLETYDLLGLIDRKGRVNRYPLASGSLKSLTQIAEYMNSTL